MALGIRGANPIWAEFDLSGKIFDDTYYMWVLENDIPYIPATVYHDPDLNTPWTQPIQFLGNGTLPVDIYFEPDVIYRLEFRQSDGLSTPTQQDPLIYLVENYIPGSGGSTPSGNVVFSSSNQVTNPQFALIDFLSPFTFTGTDPDPIKIGPGWFLELAGTGTVTLTKVPLTSTTPTKSNAPYALEINMSGWNDGSVFLRQRFFQSGVLWSNQIVSTAITARVQGLNVTISASLVDSMNATLGQLLSTTVDSTFNEYTGYLQLPPSTDTGTPPAAYIDYKLALPSNVNIFATSIQLVVQDQPFEPSFEQDSINRQIDHTYNTAYPIVPVGAIIDFFGFILPAHYLLCDYTAYNRARYTQLFKTLTNTETVTLTSAMATFTVANGAIYRIGMGLEAVGIPTGTTIIGISTNTITMSIAATASGTVPMIFFAAARVFQETVSLTNTASTFTVANGAIYKVNEAVTGAGIQAGTIITLITGNTITISLAANATISSLLNFYDPGNGDGTTTFNVPYLAGFVTAGTGDSLFSGNNAIGLSGGAAGVTLNANQIAPHTHVASNSGNNSAGTGDGATVYTTNSAGTPRNNVVTVQANVPSPSLQPVSIVQPTLLVKKCIRFE